MYLVVEANIITPIITKHTEFWLLDCQAIITNIKRNYYSKITAGIKMFPFSYICYVGKLILRFKCKNKKTGLAKLNQLRTIRSIGRYSSEGLGQIQWLHSYFQQDSSIPKIKPKRKYGKVKIRKGLPHNLTTKQQNLIRFGLLHDFFHTNKHKSKIYIEPPIKDQEMIWLCRNHHEKIENDFIIELRKYDAGSAMRTRKVRSPRTTRYNWRSTKKIDFQNLANEIAEVAGNVNKLYQYIYTSKELDYLNESFEFGHSSLRVHLLILANLIVNRALQT